jgi:hypothetical protein
MRETDNNKIVFPIEELYMTYKLTLFFVLLLIVSLSCKSPNENEILPSSPDMSQPVATGIYITDVDPTPIGVWGNPSDGSGTTGAAYPAFSINSGNSTDSNCSLQRISDAAKVAPTLENLYNPYPNPFEGPCVIDFSLSRKSDVVLYVVPARWIDEKNNDIHSSAGAVTATPQRTAIALIAHTQLAAGSYHYLWNSWDQNGNLFPPGFYRIYLRVGDSIYWHDVFLYNETTSLPMRPR